MFKYTCYFLLISTLIGTYTSNIQASDNDLFFKEVKSKYRIIGYETNLVCTLNPPISDLTQVNFDIRDSNQKIGKILIQYFPQSIPDAIIRFRYIEIQEEFRRKGHAGRALEELFSTLRQNNLPQNTVVQLECNTHFSYIKKFYEKFGFKMTEQPYPDVITMISPLNEIKFPYYCQKKH